MAVQDPRRKNFQQQPHPMITTPMVILCLTITALGYFGLVQPAQEHMASLERQCNKLVIAVKKLQSKDETARHGLRLINTLDAQSEKLASAEQVLDQFAAFRRRMAQEADAMSEAIVALQQLEQIRAEVDLHSQVLTNTASTLDEMADISVSIAASSDIARQANGSLIALGEFQADLSGSISKLSQQFSNLETQLAGRSEKLPQAERTLAQIDELCQKLEGETHNLSTAQQHLGQLAGLKQEVLEQSTDLLAAEAALDQIWDLKQGLLLTRDTVSKAQKLAIDMMLLEPVIDQVTQTLQPMAESTRLSRREAAKSPKTEPLSSVVEVVSPWSDAINKFVASLVKAEQ